MQGDLHRNVKRFRGGLVFKAHTLLYRSTPGLRVVKKKRKVTCTAVEFASSEVADSEAGATPYEYSSGRFSDAQDSHAAVISVTNACLGCGVMI